MIALFHNDKEAPLAASNFSNALALTLRFEGGYSDHPADPGGATNRGITQATLAQFRHRPVSKAEVRALTQDEASSIYKSLFWYPSGAEVCPVGVDAALFDYAVNSGTKRALAALRDVLGLHAEADHEAVLIAVKSADPLKTISALCRYRLRFLQRLRTFSVFGRGWRRRVETVETVCLAMAAAKQLSTFKKDHP